MALKRIVYRIDGKDYERNDIVKGFVLTAPAQSLQTIIELMDKHRIHCRKINNVREYPINQYSNETVKDIVIQAFPENICNFFETEFNLHDHSDLQNKFEARNNKFRKNTARRLADRVNFFSVFDPKTKEIRITSGTPLKIEGRQAVMNGKLWRKLPVKY